MKKHTYKICFLLTTLVSLSACEDYLDINENPNNPTEVPAALLMAHATYRTGDNIQLVGDITSYYVQYLASPNSNGSKDIHDGQPYDITWQDIYRMLSDLSDLEKIAEEQGASHYLGAAKVLKAINLGLAVDQWGDLPYSQAFFGEFLKPAYDNDETLYDEILSLLDEGIAELSKGEQVAVLADDDFIYEGDVNGWIKMAYSLKARYLLHMSNTSKFDPDAVLAAAALGISANGENGDITYSATAFDVYNPWAKVAINQESSILDGWISQQLADAMNGTTFGVVDPRMPFMFGDTDEGEFIGVENGAGRGTNVDIKGDRSTLMRDTYYAADDAPILIITLAEVKFIQAEAALANGDNATAYQAYLDGIAAHMDMLGVDPADASAYLADPVVAVGPANITLDLIMKEKYVALFLHPETWTDARRFNYQYTDMTLPANHNPALGGQFVRRLVYPDSEISRNLDNVPSVTILDRVWWDQ
jgi:hypothetical protein